MGVVRRARDTKSSVNRPAAVAVVVQDARVLEPDAHDVNDTLALTAELPVPHAARYGEAVGRSGAKPLGRESLREAGRPSEPFAFEGLGDGALDVTGVNTIARPDDEAGEESDVFVCRRSAPAPDEVEAKAAEAATATVTLFVYGWHQVQPGALSWVFPSLRAALAAVRTMRNAVAWCICSGERWEDIDSARANGAVLIEQLA